MGMGMDVGERAGRTRWGGGFLMCLGRCSSAHLALARLRCHVHRRRAASVASIDVSFGLEQHPHHLQPAVARRRVEGARFGGVGEAHIGPVLEQQLDGVVVAPERRHDERRPHGLLAH